MHGVSDFRSDTVTRPHAAMRRAMAEAVVGDDVFGDDPTVRDLESEGAMLFGREAALFCPSGTMANQIAVRVHTRPGDEVLLHEGCHVYCYEQGGLAALHGVQAVPLPGPRGCVPIDAFRSKVRRDDPHLCRTRLVVVENTHNQTGGCVLPPDYMAAVEAFCGEHGLALHVDGARILNASVALGIPARNLARAADTISVCLSKGLGAPAGTLLIGNRDIISKARRVRKLLGGGMRQVGILAAAGLMALREGPNDLAKDHERARHLARDLSRLKALTVLPPESNIVIVDVGSLDIALVLDGLARENVLAVRFGPTWIRLVTHRDVLDEDVERAVAAFARVLSGLGERGGSDS